MSYGKIVSIEESTMPTSKYASQDGYIINTDSGNTIWIGIYNGQCCCENWGYMTSEDNLEEFIGAEVYSVNRVDTALNVETVLDTDYGDTMFVNLETSKGTLQFVMYNEHNGYYGHEASVIINGTTILSEVL